MDKVTTQTIIEIVCGKEFLENFYRFCNVLSTNQLCRKYLKNHFWSG